jgi:hypothetical protein
MSVKDLVEKGRVDKELEWIKKREAEKQTHIDEKAKRVKQAQAHIDSLMTAFEKIYFDIDATDEEVAKCILEENYSIMDSNQCLYSQLAFREKDVRKYVDAERHSWGTSSPRDHEFYLISKYEKYNIWKKALEDKFGIFIQFREEEHEGASRGYNAPPERDSSGIECILSIK